MNTRRILRLLSFCLLAGFGNEGRAADPPCFPVVTQFTPVPSGKGWKGGDGPIDEATIRDTIDNLLEHGITGIEAPVARPTDEASRILSFAQERGMIISYHAGSLELFGRTDPPHPCVYSPEYSKAVRSNAEKALASLKAIPRLYNIFPYQDEPFHWGPKSFGYNDEVKGEFKKRFGYELPSDLDSVRADARKWLDVINFRSDYFADGWRQVYPILKEFVPGPRITLTHDSHNTFGAGYSSHSELAIDDVYHWGGDFADLFVFDISSNADIEAAVRANDREAFLFVINHESSSRDTTVELRDLKFSIGRVVDLADDREFSEVRRQGDSVEFTLSAGVGEVRLLHLLPE